MSGKEGSGTVGTRTLGATLLRNALYGGGARLATLVVGLFLTPYLWHRLGSERFGVWALATVVTGAVGLLDLSLRSALVKFLAESEARDDREARDAIATVALFAYSSLGAVVLPIFLLALPLLLRLFEVPETLREEAAFVFFVAVTGVVVAMVTSVFPALCDARQRFDVTHRLGVATLVCTGVSTVGAVELGAGLRGVALAQLGGITLFAASSVIAARRLVGPLRLDLAALRTPWPRRLLRYGAVLHLSTVCGIVNRQWDKLLLSRGAGLGVVASYEVAARVAANAGSFQPYLTASLLPAASRLGSEDSIDELRGLYVSASRLLFLVGIPPFALLAAAAPDLVHAWLGARDATAALLFQALALGYLVNSLSNGMAFVCQGMGRVDIQARQSALQLGVNVVVSAALFAAMGPLGAALGTTIALVVGAGDFARRFHPVLEVSTSELLRRAALAPLVCSSAGGLAAWLVAARGEPSDRLGAIMVLMGASCAFVVAFLAAAWLVGFVGGGRESVRGDLSELRELLRRVRGAAG